MRLPTGPGSLRVEAVEIVSTLFLLRVETSLNQRHDDHEGGEEGDNAKAEKGDVAVIYPSGPTDTVGGHRRGGENQDECRGEGCDEGCV